MNKIILVACSMILLGAGCSGRQPGDQTPVSNKTVNTNQLSESYEKQQVRVPAGRPATQEEIDKVNSEGKIVCEKAGGSWRAFDGCSDICMFARSPGLRSTCGTVKNYGCDCGADKCWTGSACEKN